MFEGRECSLFLTCSEMLIQYSSLGRAERPYSVQLSSVSLISGYISSRARFVLRTDCTLESDGPRCNKR